MQFANPETNRHHPVTRPTSTRISRRSRRISNRDGRRFEIAVTLHASMRYDFLIKAQMHTSRAAVSAFAALRKRCNLPRSPEISLLWIGWIHGSAELLMKDAVEDGGESGADTPQEYSSAPARLIRIGQLERERQRAGTGASQSGNSPYSNSCESRIGSFLKVACVPAKIIKFFRNVHRAKCALDRKANDRPTQRRALRNTRLRTPELVRVGGGGRVGVRLRRDSCGVETLANSAAEIARRIGLVDHGQPLLDGLLQ
jgi:hypothetical protein